MKVAVVGSRGLWVENLGDYLPEGTEELISGGAQGIDGVKALASAAGFVVLFIYAIQAVAYVKVFFVDKADE